MNVLSTLFDPLAYMPVLDNQLYFKITMKLISDLLTKFYVKSIFVKSIISTRIMSKLENPDEIGN